MRHSVAHVAGKYFNGASFLVNGADAIADAGGDSVKLYATPSYVASYPGQTWGATHTTLTQLAQDAAYAAVFGDSRLVRFFLNTWTFANGVNNDWINDWSNAQDLAEENELYDFCVHLLSTYSNKEFVIQNWEGDWALLGAFDTAAIANPDRMQRMAQYLRARKRAIVRARADVASSSKLVFAVEVNRCLDRFGGRVHKLLDQVRPDAVSFSLYECINTVGVNQASWEANIDSRMTEAAFRIRRVLGDNVRLYVGEYGWPEAEAGFASLDLGAAMQRVADTGDTLGMTDAVFWQVYDNEEQSPGVPRGYYMYDETNTLSEQGTKLVTLL